MWTAESVLNGEPLVAYAVGWSHWGWPAIAKAKGVPEVSLVQ